MTAHDFPELDGMPSEEAVQKPTFLLIHNSIGTNTFGTSTDQRTRDRIGKEAWSFDWCHRKSRLSNDIHGFTQIVSPDC
jgi:hypothetical protein